MSIRRNTHYSLTLTPSCNVESQLIRTCTLLDFLMSVFLHSKMSTRLFVSAGQSLLQKRNIPMMSVFWVCLWSGGDSGVVLSGWSAPCRDVVVTKVLTCHCFFFFSSPAAAGTQL